MVPSRRRCQHRSVAHDRCTSTRWERIGRPVYEREHLFLVACEEKCTCINKCKQKRCSHVVAINLISCQKEMLWALICIMLDRRFQKSVEGCQHILPNAMWFAAGTVHDAQLIYIFRWKHKTWKRVSRIDQTIKDISR